MNTLEHLRAAKSLTDVAKLLGFAPKGLSYVLYKLHSSEKYRSFEIPKKNGGTRTIKAPEPHLSLLQQRLSERLYECVTLLQKENPHFFRASYGFQKGKTIVSNAEAHRRRHFVFNLDLEDFFGTINFGRVRGYFINDRAFKLDPAVATIIAQIACHENALPQGSPCSPIISNLIGNILDSRLLALARHTRCTYTRYADDLTFSTNERLFPTEIAVNLHSSEWTVGDKLRTEIERAGFRINQVKTRMSLRRSRQTVTSLVVNEKVNVSTDYYRSVRAMCNAVFQTGSYYREDDKLTLIGNLNPLEGMLSHIHFVKARRDRSNTINKLAKKAGEFDQPLAPIALYRKFLFYKYFVALQSPLIVTEGVSDITYLHHAILSLAAGFPRLATIKDGKAIRSVNFLKPSGTTRDILDLGHGAGGQSKLIGEYSNSIKAYGHAPMLCPVIILCDNDDGPKTVFKNGKSKGGIPITTTTGDPFYYLGENLYLVKVPEGSPPGHKEIEHLFKKDLLDEKIDGKPLDLKKEHGDESAYGKVIFAEKVVRAKAKSIDFSGFSELLMRLEQCIQDYETRKAKASAPLAPIGVAVSSA